MLARFSVLSRLKAHENSNLFAKMRVYDGESLKEVDPKARTLQEYKDAAGVDEGHGRHLDALRLQGAVGDLQPRHQRSRGRSGAPDVRARAGDQARAVPARYRERADLEFIKAELAPRYAEFIGHEIQKAYLESYHDYGQNLFDRYVDYADAWIEDQDFKDPDTGQLLNRELLNQELSKIEKPAGIANPKDFRNEVVKFTLRQRAQQRRQEPVLDLLREDPRSDRAADVLASGGSAARHQLRLEEGRREREEARRVRHAHGRARLHRAASPPAGRVVHAGEAGSGVSRAHAHHRPPAESGRQKPARTASDSSAARVRWCGEAVREASSERIDQGRRARAERSSIPADGVHEPALRRPRRAGRAIIVLPGNKKYIEGDSIARPEGGGWRLLARAMTATARTISASRCRTRNISTCSSRIWSFRTSPSTRCWASRRCQPCGPAIRSSGPPARMSVPRTMRNSLSRRIGAGAARKPEDIAALEARDRRAG